MQKERTLSILYDLASTVGSEVSLEPLLVKVLQRFMFHTGFPCGMTLLYSPFSASLKLRMAIGDNLARQGLGTEIKLPAGFRVDRPQPLDVDTIVPLLPCRTDTYRRAFVLPIPDTGFIVLLSPAEEGGDELNEFLFAPVLGNLARAIELCHTNDEQRARLNEEVQERTRALHESEEYIRLLLSSTAEAIYGVDTEGCCTFANNSFLRLLGYDRLDEVLQQPIHDLVHHSHADCTPYPKEECPMQRAYSQGVRLTSEPDLFWKKDGTPINIEYSVYPIIRDGEHIGSVASFQDVTQRLALEKEQEEMRRAAESAQRLESLGVLAGGITHDFNNILTAIIGNAGLAKKELGEHAVVQDYIDPLLDASQSAADLCRQMLAYSGKGRFVVKAIDLSQVVLHMTKLLDVSISKQVTLKYDLQESLPATKVDISQIQQVVMNLITNANEAIGDKLGTISLTTGVQHLDNRYLAMQPMLGEPVSEGDYVFLEVSDNGCGIPTELREKIFDPFFTTKDTGRGLGMSAILGIVRGHGGALHLYSEVGKGTTFKMLLPMTPEDSEPLVDASPVKEAPWQASGIVLVVDDEKVVRDATTAMLEAIGFDVLTAVNGCEAVQLYREQGDTIRLVLMDMSMPVMGGEQCFRELRNINPTVKVILSSGYNEQDATQHFLGKGLAGFLQKPYMLSTLEEKLQEILA